MITQSQSKIVLLILLSVLTGCASARVTFHSSPDKAEVYVHALEEGNSKLIGVTPLTVTGSEISQIYGGSGPVTVEYRKEGFSSSKAIITDLSANDLTISLELAPVNKLNDQEKLNTMMDILFESQRLARIGRHDEALIKLRSLEGDFPYLSVIYELQGGIYFLQKKYRDSYDAYSQAMKYHPSNTDLERMKKMAETQLTKGTSSASTKQPASQQPEQTASQSAGQPAGQPAPAQPSAEQPAQPTAAPAPAGNP